LKIGINATFLHDTPTGLGVFTQEVSRCLVARNSDTRIFSPFHFEGVPESAISFVPSSIRGSTRFWNNLLRVSYQNAVLPLRCRAGKRDLLYCPMMEYPFLPLVPLVVQVHDLHPLRFLPQFGRAGLYFKLSLARLGKTARRITVVSEYVKKDLLGETGISENRIDVVLNGYNKKWFYPRPVHERKEFLHRYSLGDRYILFVGNLFPYKNVTLLIEAFLRIKNRIPHDLVIAGRREFFNGNLPQDERVRYIDYVDQRDLPRFYSYADILVHPSLSEGFGLTPLEAMACGTPVICSNRTSLPEVIGDAGLLFDPVDSTTLGELILTTIGNEGLRRKLSARGLKRAELFSWEKTAEGILHSCEKALQDGA
jgi:glycosyltransferase involved in cell wall biosynthesis